MIGSGWASIFTGLATNFCLYLLLFSACALLFWKGMTCVCARTCCHLHGTVARSKITDCLGALRLFYSRTGFVSSPRHFMQSACVIASYPLPHVPYLLLTWVDLSDLQMWDWLVQCEHLHILTAHHHQAAALTLGNFTLHFLFSIASRPLPLLRDCNLPCVTPCIFFIEACGLF